MIPARVLALCAGVAAAALLGARSSRAPGDASEPRIYAPFGDPLPDVDSAARARFARGKAVALRRFAPSNGLGPMYSAVSCGDCHENPTVGGSASRYRTVFVTSGAKETFIVPFQRHFTTDSIVREAPRGRGAAMRVPPAFFGVGLLAEIPAEEIARRADPSDRDDDGISGKVNFERGFIGRFGRKAQMSTLQGFVRLALLDHMGITTSPVTPPYLAERDAPVELATRDADGVPDPELTREDLGDLLAFVALLAPPAPDPETRETRAGAELFAKAGCEACHVRALRGPRGPIAAYTDLLLHEMGPALADGVVVGEAKGAEFRTQPLWGLAAAGPYLHDGRADTIDEAIRAHGGEAARARAGYVALTEADRKKLLAFLDALGGRGVRRDTSDPSTPYRGRAIFDHDFRRAEGLGPRFNGDACRSCHFDPVIGGAGPSDVDVVRHGFWQNDVFAPPANGDTMAHRFDLTGKPPLDPNSNLFERRQTPALFGLGLVDAIPDDAILAHADPYDRDGDGVRGIASVLPDGRVGRFGWKAQMPSLEAFVTDALANELGVTRGEISDSSFADLVSFVAHLPPPPAPPRDESGAAAFARAGCAACHVPSLAGVPLYSDLLLHDVASPDARIVGDPAFRTAPLWGIARSAPYLHDGRAETLEAAVLGHDGEAAASRERFTRADAQERAALLAFVREL